MPVIRGIDHAVTVDEAKEFFASLGSGGAMIIKALAGGGGRGTRVVMAAEEIEQTFERCRSEARAAFGRDELYVEELVTRARHVEVQILGDRTGAIVALGERECSVQRRFQKLIEIAPAPDLDDGLRRKIIDAAVRLAKSVGYSNLGTFEFLVDVSGREDAQPFAFIEANARLQVEHTVTEAVTGVDLVQTQIRLAQGKTLKELGLESEDAVAPRGYAIQARVNMETILARWHGAARQRDADSLRGAQWAWRAHRRLRLHRLSHIERLQLAAGEGDRPFAFSGFRRCRRADHAR